MINRVRADIKTAMLNKDEATKNLLRLVMGSAQLEAKEAHVEVNDTHIINAFNKELKQTNQAIAILKENGQDSGRFYEENVKKIELIMQYLPKQLSENEITEEVRKLIAGIDKTNKGLVMKTVMPALKGKADGKLINAVVQKVLKE